MLKTESHTPCQFATPSRHSAKHSLESLASKLAKCDFASVFSFGLFCRVSGVNRVISLISRSVTFRHASVKYPRRHRTRGLVFWYFRLNLYTTHADDSSRGSARLMLVAKRLTRLLVRKLYLGLLSSRSFRLLSYLAPCPLTSAATARIKVSVTASSSGVRRPASTGERSRRRGDRLRE